MTLDELLANKDLPDNTPIKVGDNEIPLGSLRQATSSQLASITERAKQLDAREASIVDRQKKVMNLAEQAQQAYSAAEEARRVAVTSSQGTPANPLDDPWLAPMKPIMDARDAKVKDLEERLNKANNMLTNAATTWAEDRWDKEYESINFGKREKDKIPSRDELIKYAVENKLSDRRGMPSIKLAWDKQTEQDRAEDIAARAREEGREQGRREVMASRIPPPGVPGSAPLPKPPSGTDKGDLGDLYAETLKDPELRALLEQLPSGMA